MTTYDPSAVPMAGRDFDIDGQPWFPVCPGFPDCREERYVSDLLASVKAEEPVGKWVSGCSACDALAKEAAQ